MGWSTEVCSATWMREALGWTWWDIDWPGEVALPFRSCVLVWSPSFLQRVVFKVVSTRTVWLDGSILSIILWCHCIANGWHHSCTIITWPPCLFKHLVSADHGFLWLPFNCASAVRTAWAFRVNYRIVVDIDERRSMDDASSNRAKMAGVSHMTFVSSTLTC